MLLFKRDIRRRKINYLNTIIIKVDFENNILVSEDNKQYTYDTLLISMVPRIEN